ncbi:hypothetical protein ACIBCP_32445 [Streptomyces sp. NPDC051287]|uniref:hypothetical protein n=1 Tax=Streptomyces sp. NPDC051287 TaxID=3365648 RepID=UPI00379B61F3
MRSGHLGREGDGESELGQWAGDSSTGGWNLDMPFGGFYKLQSKKDTGLCLTGTSDGAVFAVWMRRRLAHRTGN